LRHGVSETTGMLNGNRLPDGTPAGARACLHYQPESRLLESLKRDGG
jgi:hypothetical protein